MGDRKVSEHSLDRGRNHRIFFAPVHDSMRNRDMSGSMNMNGSDMNADVRTNDNR
jgi:hypothetical protein